MRIIISQKKANSIKCLPFAEGAHLPWPMDLDLPKQIQYTKYYLEQQFNQRKEKRLNKINVCHVQWVPVIIGSLLIADAELWTDAPTCDVGKDSTPSPWREDVLMRLARDYMMHTYKQYKEVHCTLNTRNDFS